MTNTAQCMTALAIANETRYARARIRRRLEKLTNAEGRQAMAEILANPPECLDRAIAFDVLKWVKWMTASQANGLLQIVGAGDRRMVKDLTFRQRQVLGIALRRKWSPADLRAILAIPMLDRADYMLYITSEEQAA